MLDICLLGVLFHTFGYLLDYKTVSTTPDGVRWKYVLSIIDHLTRFALLMDIHSNSNKTVAQILTECVIRIFGSPELLRSNLGMEFENQIVHQLQLL